MTPWSGDAQTGTHAGTHSDSFWLHDREPPMPLLLGATPLILPTPEVLTAADAMLPGLASGLWEASPYSHVFGGSGIHRYAARQPDPGAFNVLAWPVWGLSRWAVGHFLASAEQAESVRVQAFGSGGTQNVPLTLRIHAELAAAVDGQASDVVDHTVFMLPPKVIGRQDPIDAETTEGLYCLTVVDARYYLRTIPVPTTLSITRTTTWNDLMGAIGAALGVSWSWSTVPSDYGKPHPKLLDARWSSLPVFADAVAASVGQRIVAYRNGSFASQDVAAALTARNAADLVGSTPVVRPRLAGGSIRQTVL